MQNKILFMVMKIMNLLEMKFNTCLEKMNFNNSSITISINDYFYNFLYNLSQLFQINKNIIIKISVKFFLILFIFILQNFERLKDCDQLTFSKFLRT